MAVALVAAPLFFAMKRKLHILIALVGLTLVIVGSVFMMKNSLVNEEYNYTPEPNEVVAQDTSGQSIVATPIKQNTPQSPGYPVRIQIDEVDINLPIAKGYYNKQNKKWTISRNSAYYAVMTSRPNTTSGNTFIYGHNRSNVFSRLLKIKPGSVAYVTTDNNQRFIYKLSRSFTTNPNDSSILYYQGAPILTLQTCSGANFQDRTLFVFELVGVTDA